MSKYAVCQILGKQYKILPGVPFNVDKSDEVKKIEADVLLISTDGKIEVGKPILKEKISLDVLEQVKGEKVRVAKFHAKANFRRVTGMRPKYTKVVWSVKSAS